MFVTEGRITQRYKLQDIYAFSKSIKKEYKAENNKPLSTDVLYHITFACIQGQGIVARYKMPDIEDVVRLVKLGCDNCSDEAALIIIENNIKDKGLLGIFIDCMVELFFDTQINSGYLKAAKEMQKVYYEPDEDEDGDTTTDNVNTDNKNDEA